MLDKLLKRGKGWKMDTFDRHKRLEEKKIISVGV